MFARRRTGRVLPVLSGLRQLQWFQGANLSRLKEAFLLPFPYA